MKYKFNWAEEYCGSNKWLEDRTILLTVHGSHAYGLNTPTSDLDVKGIAIPTLDYYTGFLKKFEQDTGFKSDVCVYDIKKFFQLATDCNPNIIELLYTDEEFILKKTPEGQQLIDNRDLFLSKKAKFTFSGYAISQLKRIKTHKKWLLHPPDHKPTREEFGLMETSLLSADIVGAIDSMIGWKANDPEEKEFDEDRVEGVKARFGANVMTMYRKERAYHNAMMNFHQYENWKNNRNPARAELEAKYGYDCKHAMHLVRLLRMCREILEGKGVIVIRSKDRDELLAIRNGAWNYDFLLEWADSMDKEMDSLYETSKLQKEPNRKALDKLCSYMIRSKDLEDRDVETVKVIWNTDMR